MEKNTSHILDIHTHKSEEASRGRAIINYQLPVGGALCLSSFYSAGIHPWQLTERDAEEQLAYLQKLLVEERLVAVGERRGLISWRLLRWNFRSGCLESRWNCRKSTGCRWLFIV